jgi:hypothetical protein
MVDSRYELMQLLQWEIGDERECFSMAKLEMRVFRNIDGHPSIGDVMIDLGSNVSISHAERPFRDSLSTTFVDHNAINMLISR